jgi:hypothetical protein
MFSTNLVLILYDLPNIQKKRLNPAYPALKSASQGAHKMTELNRIIKIINLYPSTAISLQREIKSKKARDAGLTTPPNAPHEKESRHYIRF